MDDTRDIAIRAEAEAASANRSALTAAAAAAAAATAVTAASETAKSAHKRLDTINGQMARLGESHERMRDDFNVAINDPENGLRVEISAMRADVRVEKVKVAAIVAGVSIVFTGVTSAVAISVAEHYAGKQRSVPTQAVPHP